jgi:hypothetical protein
MPAQSKYLSTKGERAIKLCTAVLGGYLVSAGFHLFLTALPQTRGLFIILSGITFFVVWGGLMVTVFFFKRAWKGALVYWVLSLLFFALTWLIL